MSPTRVLGAAPHPTLMGAGYTRYILLAHWRTGSTLLTNMLARHPQIAAHREVFNPQVQGVDVSRAEALRHWLSRLGESGVVAPSQKGIGSLGAGRLLDEHVWHGGYAPHFAAVGLKVLSYQLSPNGRFPHLASCLRERMPKVRPIVLRRDNLLKMHVSFAIAKRLKQWNVRRETDKLVRPVIELKPADLEREFRWYEALDRDLLTLASAAPQHYPLTYEEFTRRKAFHWRQICAYLGVKETDTPSDPTVKLETRRASEAVGNYAELARYFAGTRWGRFFDE